MVDTTFAPPVLVEAIRVLLARVVDIPATSEVAQCCSDAANFGRRYPRLGVKFGV